MSKYPLASAAEIARGSREMAIALAAKSDVELTCRGMRHAWKQEGDMQMTAPFEKGDLPTIKLLWKCMRGCGVQRYDILTVRPMPKTREYRIVDRSVGHYVYPVGYQIPGVPRGVKPAIIIWQEFVRRANEKSGHALPGQRERAS